MAKRESDVKSSKSEIREEKNQVILMKLDSASVTFSPSTVSVKALVTVTEQYKGDICWKLESRDKMGVCARVLAALTTRADGGQLEIAVEGKTTERMDCIQLCANIGSAVVLLIEWDVVVDKKQQRTVADKPMVLEGSVVLQFTADQSVSEALSDHPIDVFGYPDDGVPALFPFPEEFSQNTQNKQSSRSNTIVLLTGSSFLKTELPLLRLMGNKTYTLEDTEEMTYGGFKLPSSWLNLIKEGIDRGNAIGEDFISVDDALCLCGPELRVKRVWTEEATMHDMSRLISNALLQLKDSDGFLILECQKRAVLLLRRGENLVLNDNHSQPTTGRGSLLVFMRNNKMNEVCEVVRTECYPDALPACIVSCSAIIRGGEEGSEKRKLPVTSETGK